jgi:DNA-binding transcriptional MerR regulator
MAGAAPTGTGAGAKPRTTARVRAGSLGKAPRTSPKPVGLPAGDLFSDGKDSDALRTIGEVARALGLRQHVLRYWEDQFPTLRPLTRAGGRRYYRSEDIALLREIDRLVHREGYTLRGARLALGRPGGRRAAGAALPAAIDADRSAAQEQEPREPATAETPEPEAAIIAALAVLRSHLEAIRSRLAAALAA